MHAKAPCTTPSVSSRVASGQRFSATEATRKHLRRCSTSRHVCRAAEGQPRQGQSGAELYRGELKDNRRLRKVLSTAGEDAEDLSDDEEDEEEDEKHGLEDLGQAFLGQLNATQEKYKEKLKRKVEEDKEAERLRQEERSREFTEGKYAYEKGRYTQSVELLELALEKEGSMSGLGGDIQLWLALAYQAAGRDKDCIDLYKRIEINHPLVKVRRQAENLRFILEAPKLKRGPDEVVKIPVLEIEERKVARRGIVRRPIPTAAMAPKREKTLEERFWDDYKPPKWTQNRYVWVASGVLAGALTIYSIIYL